MAANRLTPDERRAVIIEALKPDANKSQIARDFGIYRTDIYALLDHALADPRGKLRDTERELAFRKQVVKLAG